jgi:site-specific DNA-adenine methylase
MHSFNHMIHINSKGEFNTPSGCNRSYFSSISKFKLIKYVEKLHKLNINFSSLNGNGVLELLSSPLEANLENYMFFIDPPYLLTDSSYSRVYGLKWLEEHEINLYNSLDKIHERNGKFLLTNVLTKGDETNIILDKWKDKYNVIQLEDKFKNCNYQKKGKNRNSLEIIVKNY